MTTEDPYLLIACEIHELIKSRRGKSVGKTIKMIEDMLVGKFAADTAKTLEAHDNPMSQEQVEAWIMLQGQKGVRWFNLQVLDPQMNKDPTLTALMTAIADSIFEGMTQQEFQERQANAGKMAESGIITPKPN